VNCQEKRGKHIWGLKDYIKIIKNLVSILMRMVKLLIFKEFSF